MNYTLAQIAKLRTAFLSREAESFDRLLGGCSSPIEQLFLAYAIHDGWLRAEQFDWSVAYNFIRDTFGAALPWQMFVREDIVGLPTLIPQLPLSLRGRRRRLDFAILQHEGERHDFSKRFAIELDGHDFHERTKEQAERDKSGDRLLLLDGWKVLRFTGSEIVRDVEACWGHVHVALGASWAS